MAEYRRVGKAAEVPEGGMVAYEVGGVRVAVAKVGGELFAFEDTCTHERCSLSEGELEGTSVVCPCHGAEFDIRTGEVLALPASRPIRTYRVRLQGEDLEIEV